jgi:hypothetical protein
MAYVKEDIVNMALEAIDKEDCVNIEEVISCLPIATSTFYAWELEKSESIRTAINQKKVALKKAMRKKWRGSDNATLQIAEFRLMATDEEREAISVQTVKQDTNLTVQGKPTIQIDFGKEG